MDSIFLNSLEETINEIADLHRDAQYLNAKRNSCIEEIAILTQKKDLIASAKEWHKKAIDILYQTSVKELENLVNDVVSAIFYDRNFSVKMELTDSRSKSLIWWLHDNDMDIDIDIKEDVGRGVRTVLSFIIQSYYILSLGSKYLFIDEGYSYISEAYVDKFFEFVKLLCNEKNLSLIMISHDNRFSGYADKCYYVSEGRVTLEE